MFVDLNRAIEILKQDMVVAIPTETVYGLAGRISSQKSLEAIFTTKKRPFFDPLIVHVKDKSQAQSLTAEWSLVADAMADQFWPGPLTLVIKKNPKVLDVITAGLERVGLRCPNHPLALKVLNQLGEPFAAPSANLFGRTSPTTAQHVESEFQGKVPVLDGGACDIGIESTVLLVDQNKIAILRKGHIRQDEITSALNNRGLGFEWLKEVSKTESPGHMKHHYMPSKPLFWVSSSLSDTEILQKINSKLKSLPQEVEGVKLIVPPQVHSFSQLTLPSDPSQAARALYAELRRLAEGPEDCLVFRSENNQDQPEWEAVMERLKKATSSFI